MNPTDVTLDFEMAVMNAIRTHFPLAEIHGCSFHFGQNIWRKVQEVGLQSVYSKDPNFALQIRLLTALAFVPPDSLIDAYEELIATEFYAEDTISQYNQSIQALLAYFQTTYVYRIDRTGKKQQPMHPPNIWNVYEATLSGTFTALQM